ncbi:TRAP transport system, periplasmic binding protein (DctP-like) [Desulfonema limicola]|uniref:TRAP transport system, periplasmic binding protein (DctP-like) n=1 Tax=Desulfonema limicola TaxID=45656 RepID=A0A975GHV0_9BACT|nr:C4-dicarboxylate TRAP transporter substrate-binding protein [Desulfonema limicola]QTA81837.1 TRAP transport system, periplasmic binding protein (DctP-like) [Desulfonema limicola]
MKYKSRVFIFLMLIMAVMAFTGSSLSAQTILKMNHQFPAAASGSKLDQWFADEIKRATNNEIEIRIFWSNALGSPKKNLVLLSSGIIDMAAMSPGYFPLELPFFSASNSIPMGMDNICQASVIMQSFMKHIPQFADEAEANNIRPLFFHLINPYLLVTKKPVTKFSDLKGLRIRVWGEYMPEMVKAANGKPMNIFLPDLYETMKRGVLDACPFSLDLVKTYKIYETAKHITEVVLWEGTGWGIWISEKSWAKLSPEHQKIFADTADKVWAKDMAITAEAEVEARKFLKYQGVEFHEFPPEELAKWQAANPDFFENWIKKMESMEKGEPARQTVELWKDLRQIVKCPNITDNN